MKHGREIYTAQATKI